MVLVTCGADSPNISNFRFIDFVTPSLYFSIIMILREYYGMSYANYFIINDYLLTAAT